MTPSETALIPSLHRATRATPLLSLVEEQRLARAARGGDAQALENLLRPHFRLVLAIAHEHSRRCAGLEDLIGEGMLGLLEAAQRFDPERDVRFAAYAAFWIRAYVRRYTLRYRRAVRLPSTRNARIVLAHLHAVQAKLERESGEAPTHQQVAGALGVSEQDVIEMDTALRSRDVPCGVEVNGATFELSSDDPSPEQALLRRREVRAAEARVKRALGQLDSRERHILQRRQLTDDVVTLREIGQELGISHERVRQIEVMATNKLRQELVHGLA
jgi:RNA polymerase sigma-32 factor